MFRYMANRKIIDIENRKENNFEISLGNLQVLKTIPDMMIEPTWRNKLRKLVLDYLSQNITRGNIRKMSI